jgi:7-keto-8-aminopelargonate synthetase-like enzyme
MEKNEDPMVQHVKDNFKDYTYDMFMMNMSAEPEEMTLFSTWVDTLNENKMNSFEATRTSAQTTEVDLVRESGEKMHLLNFSSYNYLGLSYHPEVIKAAQDAVGKHGLGASSSPVISGTYSVHRDLQQGIIDFFGLPGYDVSLFSSGYAVNLGVIQAFMKPGSVLVLDTNAHMSILEGATLSGATIKYFRHNDMEHLEEVLKEVCDGYTRVLIGVEGVYSGDGDYGNIKGAVTLAKKYGAYTMVDEAHSVLVAGENGKGVCEMQGVLADVDLYIMTFSKGFGGVGGALWAKKEYCRYINFYAKCRMFSCALDPAVTGGMVKSLELGAGPLGDERRKRVIANAKYFLSLLEGKVDLGVSESWIVTIVFGQEKKTLDLNDFLQQNGLDTSIMQFPAVPKNEARIRMFVTSEHTKEQIETAARVLLLAAEKFDFLL